MTTTASTKPLRPFVVQLPGMTEDYRRLLDESNTVNYHSGCVTLPPGASVGEHSTKDHEEVIVFLAGEAEIHAESLAEPLLVLAPTVSYMPPRTRHNVVNCGRSPLRYIYIVSRV